MFTSRRTCAATRRSSVTGARFLPPWSMKSHKDTHRPKMPIPTNPLPKIFSEVPMSEKIYVDQRVPNDAQPYQKLNVGAAPVNANAQPQRAIRTANSPEFQPSPVGTML